MSEGTLGVSQPPADTALDTVPSSPLVPRLHRCRNWGLCPGSSSPDPVNVGKVGLGSWARCHRGTRLWGPGFGTRLWGQPLGPGCGTRFWGPGFVDKVLGTRLWGPGFGASLWGPGFGARLWGQALGTGFGDRLFTRVCSDGTRGMSSSQRKADLVWIWGRNSSL